MMSSLSPFKQAASVTSEQVEEFFSVVVKLKDPQGIVRLCENAVLPTVKDIAKLLAIAYEVLLKNPQGRNGI